MLKFISDYEVRRGRTVLGHLLGKNPSVKKRLHFHFVSYGSEYIESNELRAIAQKLDNMNTVCQLTHEQWCEKQHGCIVPGAKPCAMCKRAYEAALNVR